MNYQINPNSWHYRLWSYLTTSTIPVMMTDGIPKDLCSYINRLVLYFFVQVPVLAWMGAVLLFALVLNPLVSLGIIVFARDLFINEGVCAFGLAIMLLYCIVGLCLFVMWFREWKQNYDYERSFNRTESKFSQTASKVTAVAVSPFRILWDFVVATHNKVCLKLDLPA